MTHEMLTRYLPSGADAGGQLAQLRNVLLLVEQIAGRIPWPGGGDAALDEGARLSSAYERAMPVSQKRFDALAMETANWAAAGVEALLAAQDGPSPEAAAAVLADELSRAISELPKTLRR